MDTGGKLVNNDTVQLSVTDECGYVLSYLTKVRVRITSCPTNNMDAMRNTHPKGKLQNQPNNSCRCASIRNKANLFI